jgi:hypothetical protein
MLWLVEVEKGRQVKLSKVLMGLPSKTYENAGELSKDVSSLRLAVTDV